MADKEHDGTSEWQKEAYEVIKKRKVVFGDTEFKAGLKGTRLTTALGDTDVKARVGYDGEWNVTAKKPMFGGNGTAEANSKGNWEVKVARPLFGGKASVSAREQNGAKRFYFQYSKRF